MKTILILGVDGAGKSTLIKAIFAEFENSHELKYYHLRPNFKFSKTTDGAAKLGGSATNPHDGKPRQVVPSLFKVCYYFCDYWFGHFSDKRHHGSKDLVRIFDRHFLDLANDPVRYRLQGVSWFVKLLYKFLPKADIGILISGDPELLWKRKKELSHQETQKQVQRLEQLAKKYKWHIIRNDKSLEVSSQELLTLIGEIL